MAHSGRRHLRMSALFLRVFNPLTTLFMLYELLYIIPATRTETEVQGVKQEISSVLAKYSNSVQRDELLGKIKLAYPIAGVRYGYYTLVVFESAPEKLSALDQELRHSQDVLRHLITIAEADAATKPVTLVEFKIPDPEQRRKSGEKKAEKEADSETPAAAPVAEGALEKQMDALLSSDSVAEAVE